MNSRARSLRLLRVFVGSPTDTIEERRGVEKVAMEFNKGEGSRTGVHVEVLTGSDAVPGMGRAEGEILDQLSLAGFDIFVGILWHRFGTPTGAKDHETGLSYESGTE